MKVLLLIIRIFVGLLFIFSGLIKANDPMGLSYKMQEFFEVWGLQSLNHLTLAFALIMNTFEIIAGVAVILGWRMRLFSWLLLLLIIFFTFLTGYALFSGRIKTCGCFGDCIPLTAKQSFLKDLLLLLLIVVIFNYRNTVKPLLAPMACMLLILLTFVFGAAAQSQVLQHLPVVDCLPYAKGKNLLGEMKLPPGALPDSFSIKFNYKKAGRDLEFDGDHFPDDFNDSSYTFIGRTETLVRPATGQPAITDFLLFSQSGADTTNAILAQPGYYVMLMSKDAHQAEEQWSRHALQVARLCHDKSIPFFMVTSTVDAAKQQLSTDPNINYLTCDATVIKTAGRVNPTYFLMKGATVQGKYANADVQKVIEAVGAAH